MRSDIDSRIPVIDLFAGPGGLAEGFSAFHDEDGNVFRVCLSAERDQYAHSTLELRSFFRQFPRGQVPDEYYSYLRKEISREKLFSIWPEEAERARQEAWQTELGSEKLSDDEIDARIKTALGNAKKWVLIGGPPCLAYLTVGRSRNKGEKSYVYVPEKDNRHFLYREYLKILARQWPPVFVVENVKGILSAKVNGSRIFDHILEKFTAEFETYWHSQEFIPYDLGNPSMLRQAIEAARSPGGPRPADFFDLRPHSFQGRILEALALERTTRGHYRNLVIAATGTGKTVIAAFDYLRYRESRQNGAKLLFIAHRQEILEQAILTFRNVLRDHSFGELLVGPFQADRLEHLFCSVGMLTNRRLWEQVGTNFYDYIVVDEAHHGTAASYRPLFDHFSPNILLGLTATPERMNGGNVAADFDNRFAAEIRLPEALEEKLLCPFHYFGIADPVDISADCFWKNGRYDERELEKIYTGEHILARQRLEVVLSSLSRYEPIIERVKGIGFCITINHALFMAKMFCERGIPSAAFVSGVNDADCATMLEDLKSGRLIFLFTVDKLSEGVDLPDVNTVLFLRPTQSLTVFLQQLGRGLRHAPGKDCLTVLDFVGQVHRRYRMDIKLKALLSRHRFSIDHEVEHNFPHLPAGCSIQLDKVSRQYVLENIRTNLRNLATQVPERLQTFASETGQELTFGNFVRYHEYEPEQLLVAESWTGWKSRAQLASVPQDPDYADLKKTLLRAAAVSGPNEIALLRQVIRQIRVGNSQEAVALIKDRANLVYYRFWSAPRKRYGFTDLEDSFARLARNKTILEDMDEVLAWAEVTSTVSGLRPDLPFSCHLELYAQYSIMDIQAAFDRANLESAGQRGVGVLHFKEVKAYALLITYQKTEKEFSPSTMYADYPISRHLLHWESQSNTSQQSNTGQNLINHLERGYTILVFARDQKKRNSCTVPFVYLGPAEMVSYESERPIKMVWNLRHPMPVEMFEENRHGG